jgi:hypothetical protein
MAAILDITSKNFPTTVATQVKVDASFIATATGGDVATGGVMGMFLAPGAPGSVTITDPNSGQSNVMPPVTCDNSGNCSGQMIRWLPNSYPIPNGTAFNIAMGLTFPSAGSYTLRIFTGNQVGSNITIWKIIDCPCTVGDSPDNPVFHVSIAPQGSMTKSQSLPVQVTVTCNVAAPRNPTVTLTALDSAGASVGTAQQVISMTGQTTATVTMNILISGTVAGSSTPGSTGTICPTIT